MKKKIIIIIGILIFAVLLSINKRIVDENNMIAQAEVEGELLLAEREKDESNARDGEEGESKEPELEDEGGFIARIKEKFIGSKESVKEEEYNNKIKISLVGDILLDGHIRDYIGEHGYDYPWEYVREYFQNDDISIGNLETSVTRSGSPWPNKQFNFRSDPQNIAPMKNAGIDIVSLANNHTLDYGYEGLEDTIRYLDLGGIKSVGAGKNIEEATKAVIVEKEETKIGVLGYSRVAPDIGWWPNSDKAGVASAYDRHLEEVLGNIEKVRSEVDILIMMVHWGKELHESPREDEILAAKKMVDSGVDVVVGHHPHVLQGIEIYKGKPIFYSLGNFIFSSRSELSGNTMVAQLNFNHRKLENIEVVPLHIKNSRPKNVGEEGKEQKLDYLREISSKFKTEIDGDGKIYIE